MDKTDTLLEALSDAIAAHRRAEAAQTALFIAEANASVARKELNRELDRLDQLTKGDFK